MRRLIVFLLIISSRLSAQELSIKQFRVENGLPTDIVRTIAQDTLGYLWFGTDDGLIKFDGNTFTSYPNATPGTSIKSIYTCDDGKIFALSDMGLTQIVNLVDTLYFDTKIHGAPTLEDNKLWNPKSVFEDHLQRFWFGEPQSISRYYKGDMKRFLFPEKFLSTSYERSFTFTLDHNETLFAASYNGYLLIYDETIQDFVEIELPQHFTEINQVFAHRNSLFIATFSGLYRFNVIDKKVENFLRIGDIDNLSYITSRSDDVLIVTSFNSEFYLISNTSDKNPVIKRFEGGLPGINNAFISNENDIWLSTEKGGVILQDKPFQKAKPQDDFVFVNAVTGDNELQFIYVAARNLLERYPFNDNQLGEPTVLMEGRKTDFLSLEINSNGLWASNMSALHLFKGNELSKTYDFSKDGGFLLDILSDVYENIWVAQEGSNSIKRIAEDEIKYYKSSYTSGINALALGSNTLFAGGTGEDTYLLEYVPKDDAFKNISVPIPFQLIGLFKVNELAFTNDIIWLATSEGLMYYENGKVDRIDIGEKFTDLNVRSLVVENDSTLWFSNPYGLVKYNINSQDFSLFDETSGLPSNYIGPRGIFICKGHRIWTGTASGLAYSNFGAYTEKATQKPQVVQITVNGKSTKFFDKMKVTYAHDALVNVHYSSISFPNNDIQYSYRIDKGPWSKPIITNQIQVPNLEPGNHQFEIKAKNTGRLTWSKITLLDLHIETVFIQTWMAKSLLIIMIMAIVFITYKSTLYILRRRQVYLEKLILERTRALEGANRNLEHKNEELTRAEEMLQKQFNELERTNKELDQFVYSASHDLSAPLKSLSGLVYIAKHETKEKSQNNLLEMMQDSISKLENFIKDVINYSRNSRVDLIYNKINLHKMVEEIASDLSHSKDYQMIEFKNNIEVTDTLVSDKTRIKIILNNLISNAIKFQRHGGSNKPYIKVDFEKNGAEYKIIVEDNGIGIKEDFLSKIFDMFYRANQDSNGSGLGLYILKETVEKLGGSVNVESTYNIGSVFTANIPIPKDVLSESIDVELTNIQPQ